VVAYTKAFYQAVTGRRACAFIGITPTPRPCAVGL